MGVRWLKVEPPRLALLAGFFFGTVAMLFYFVRQCLGIVMDPMDVVLGVGKTFLVSYAGVGFFVWYLLRVAEREFAPPPKTPPKKKSAQTEEHSEIPEEIINNWEKSEPVPDIPEEHL